MSRWFRHYAGMMRDEKLVRAALKCKQPIERVLWVWGAILESAAEIDDAGKFEVEAAEIAYFLRADEADIRIIMGALEALGRVHGDVVVKWGDRQFQSDRSAERQRRYRERKRPDVQGDEDHTVTSRDSDGEVTAPSRHGDAPETETETEKIDANASSTPPARKYAEEAFEEFKRAYPKREGNNPWHPARKKFFAFLKSGVEFEALLAGAKGYAAECQRLGKVGTEYVKQAQFWLSQRCWEGYQAADGVDPRGPPQAPPGAPSDEELRRKYATNANRENQEPEDSPLLRGRLGVHREGEPDGKVTVLRGGVRNTGMVSVGAILPRLGFGALPDAHGPNEAAQLDDNAGPVAGVVRQRLG